MRKVLVVVHRYAGLATAAFLVAVGLTGSLLAFLPELERLTARRLFATTIGAVALDPPTLIERGQALESRVRVVGVSLKDAGRASVLFQPRIDPATGQSFALDFTELFIDPYTGRELGRRRYGDLSQGRINLLPFIYNIHRRLLLSQFGYRLLGVVALIWTVDCFAALCLTLPRRHARDAASQRSWFVRWARSGTITLDRSAFRLNFDLHRAGGLWLWAMLLVFAWSSVYLNFHDVYARVTRVFLDYPANNNYEHRAIARPVEHPTVTWREAEADARAELARAGLTLRRIESLTYSPGSGIYTYRVATNLDIQDSGGRTFVMVDGTNGAVTELRLPSGQYSGLTLTNWLYALHMANVFGLPYRVLVFIVGIVMTMLSVTGVYIWWKKRRFRQFISERARLRPEAAPDTSSAVASQPVKPAPAARAARTI